MRVREQEEDGKDRKGAVDMVYCVQLYILMLKVQYRC